MTKYEEVGVEARKKGIEVFKSSVKNLFPSAFCTVGRDPELEDQGTVLHTDSAGSKPVQNYLHWKETGDISWFESSAQDAMAMNIDDLMCIGARPLAFVDYIALNKKLLPKEKLLSALNSGFEKVLDLMRDNGIDLAFLGGETADLPDQLKTLDVSVTIHGRVDLSEAITGEKVESGNLIVGLRSGGKTKYEEEKSSGIQCNGITLARHCLLKEEYGEKYPEIVNAERDYFGEFSYDESPESLDMTIGEAIISPTRIYAPVLEEMLEEYRDHITGLVHNTGGGQTKSLALGKNIHYLKDDPIEPDPIFPLIQKASNEKWRNMYEDYNMGTGFEILVEENYAEEIMKIAEKFNLEAKIIGRCKKSEGGNKVTIQSKFGTFKYRERD